MYEFSLCIRKFQSSVSFNFHTWHANTILTNSLLNVILKLNCLQIAILQIMSWSNSYKNVNDYYNLSDYLNLFAGELYVIVEYCHFGNLRSYLLKHKEDFKDIMNDYVDPVTEKKREAQREAAANKPYYINKAPVENTSDLVGPPLTTKNLICWSFQVARGMEYLASKKVSITSLGYGLRLPSFNCDPEVKDLVHDPPWLFEK